MLFRLLPDAFSMFVQDFDSEFFVQLLGGHANTGAACANSGKTSNLTGRNSTAPAIAESIIETILSVLRRISLRASSD
jgi:hypothetical protein